MTPAPPRPVATNPCVRLLFALALLSYGCAAGTSNPAGFSEPSETPSYRSDGGTSTFDECAAVALNAEETIAPVDIIWVIDSSGSMNGEARIIQGNMNSFAATISGSGLDYRVVVISARSYVNVPDPLGSDTEHFLFVNHAVLSHAPLTDLLGKFNAYKEFLRPDAVTHIVGVTDDESSLGWGDFQDSMEEKLGHEFTFHAIASEEAYHEDCSFLFCDTEPGCEGPNGEAADIGERYYRGAERTGGLIFSICTTDWSELFRQLAETIAVAAPLPCSYEMPEAPAGMELSPAKVNVVYRRGGRAEETLRYTGGADSCGSGGWYYDDADAPVTIHLCGETCGDLSTDLSGSISISLGCDTVPL